MRKIHFIFGVLLICFACSGHEYIDEFEKEIINDTTCTNRDDSLNHHNDSIDKQKNDTSSASTGDSIVERVRSFSVLGNSISTYSGYIPSGYANYYTASKLDVKDTWWMQLSSKDDLELASNASWSASFVTNKTGENANSFFTSENRIKALSAKGIPNIIFVLGGTNDWGKSTGYLGDYPSENHFDLTTFRGAYSYLVVQLKNKYPKASIICCSILPRKQSRTQKNSLGVTQQDIDESIKYICNYYNTYFMDMSICGLEKNINKYTIDGLHPNKEGMKIIADYIYHQMKEKNM